MFLRVAVRVFQDLLQSELQSLFDLSARKPQGSQIIAVDGELSQRITLSLRFHLIQQRLRLDDRFIFLCGQGRILGEVIGPLYAEDASCQIVAKIDVAQKLPQPDLIGLYICVMPADQRGDRPDRLFVKTKPPQGLLRNLCGQLRMALEMSDPVFVHTQS